MIVMGAVSRGLAAEDKPAAGSKPAAKAKAPAAPVPATDKPRPIFEKEPAEHATSATVTTSDGKSASGQLYTKLDMPLTVFDRARKRFVAFTLKDISGIDVSVEEEKDEPSWYWKESGSDEKVFTGKTYPVRKYVTKVTFADGKAITGDVSGPVYLKTTDGREIRYVLYRKQKGNEGQKLSDLVHVTSIVLSGAKGDTVPSEKPGGGAFSTDSKL